MIRSPHRRHAAYLYRMPTERHHVKRETKIVARPSCRRSFLPCPLVLRPYWHGTGPTIPAPAPAPAPSAMKKPIDLLGPSYHRPYRYRSASVISLATLYLSLKSGGKAVSLGRTKKVVWSPKPLIGMVH